MKKITLLGIGFLTLLFSNFLTAQNIVINEIQSSNYTTISDDDDSYQDWIELYYTGTVAFNLQGYGLSDDPALPYKWVFPTYWIEPGDHMLIWCSDKNRTNINFDLHTNFKISSSGDVITLTRPNGTVADTYAAIAIPQDISYGRATDGATTKVFFAQPTPGAANTTTGYTSVMTKPTITVNSGFFTNSFTTTITQTNTGATIVYTLDGSDPDISNLAGTNYNYKNKYVQLPGQTAGPMLQNNFKSFQYATALTISDRTSIANDLAKMSSTYNNNPTYIPSFNVFKGTTVRARVFKTGALPSEIVTKTYFVNPQGANRFNLPVISISVPEKELYDYNEGINVAGVDFDAWRAANPSLDAIYNGSSNYDRSGVEFEKVANLNYFVNGVEVLNQRIGIRMNGGASREQPTKSIRLLARSEFGKSTMEYPFFSNKPYTDFKRLVLRNSGQDLYSMMFRDAFGHDLFSKLITTTRAYQPSIAFLNGEYWGVLNIREHYDDDYFKQVYDINKGELDFLKNDLRADYGDQNHYNAMIAFMENNNLSTTANYNYIKTQLDPDNFRDYFIANIYCENLDWPGWNTVFWRKRTASYIANAPTGQDGRWRTGINDLDDGFGYALNNSTHNTLAFATAVGGPEYPNPEWSTLILRKLLTNTTFKNDFINRFADLLNTNFLPTYMVSKINQFKAGIETSMPEHIDRWKTHTSMASWQNHINETIDFANTRPNNQRSHIRTQFGITGDINVTLNVNNTTRGYVKMNTVDIKSTTPGVSANPYPWTGIYFKAIPVTIKAIALPGYQFTNWSGASSSTTAEITLTSSSNLSLTANFSQITTFTEAPIYNWVFDGTMANNLPLTSIYANFHPSTSNATLTFQSCLVGYPFDSTSPSWRKASMERRNNPTDLNYIPEANNNVAYVNADVKGLQIKQPFQSGGLQNTMIINASTFNYKDIKLAFAVVNELAANAVVVDYSVAAGTPVWITTGLTNSSTNITAAFQVLNYNFTSNTAVNNNANFKIRIRFTGTNMTEDLGNRVTFNNVSIKGVQLALGLEENQALSFKVYPNPVVDVLHVDHVYNDVTYKVISIEGKLIKSGKLNNFEIYTNDLQNGIYLLQLTSEDKTQTVKFIKQ